VLDSLVGACGYIHGIDHSEEMLTGCLAKGPELVAQFKLAVGKGTGRRRKTARMVPWNSAKESTEDMSTTKINLTAAVKAAG